VDEERVDTLVYEISRNTFGENHPTTQFALEPPIPRIPPSELQPVEEGMELELIRDFEKSNLPYIS
jgi:hypothetical protein